METKGRKQDSALVNSNIDHSNTDNSDTDNSDTAISNTMNHNTHVYHNTTVYQLKEKVVLAGIRLVESGLIARTWGNVSCRIDEETFAITASGRDYLTMTPEEIVIVKISDLSYEGEIKPSGEKAVHAEIYKARPDVQFVIHTHQENASIVGTLGLKSLDLKFKSPYLGSQVICAEYGLPGTKKLRLAVADALKASDGHAIIMKNHGAVCFGESDAFAFQTAQELENVSGKFLESELEKQPLLVQIESHENRLDDLEWKRIQKAVLESQSSMQAIQFSNAPFTRAFSNLNVELKPYLDDFAQIVGTNVRVVSPVPRFIARALKKSSAVFIKGIGAICIGENERDTSAVQMILEKNAKAYICGQSMQGNRPLSWMDTHLMRFVYLKKYAKQMTSKRGGQS